MDQRQWDEAYASAELVWTAEANRFVVEELAGLAAGHDVDNIAHGYGGPQDPRILHRVQDVVAALPGLAIQRAEQARRPVLTGDGERAAIDSVVRAQRG